MEQRTEDGLAPYRIFSRAEWAKLRADTPMTLTPAEVGELRSLNDRLDMKEVEEIYLPLSRLLALYVEATQRLFRVQQRFLGTGDAKLPYIVGVAGSVAVRASSRTSERWSFTSWSETVTSSLAAASFAEPEGAVSPFGWFIRKSCARPLANPTVAPSLGPSSSAIAIVTK